MKEVRLFEARAAETRGALTLEGRAIVFDAPTTINDPKGKYTEIIRSGALAEADPRAGGTHYSPGGKG